MPAPQRLPARERRQGGRDRNRGIPYTILRATQCLEFLPQIVEAGAKVDTVRLSIGLMQFVAADDVADTVAADYRRAGRRLRGARWA
jgi:hypothetical protein